MLHLQVRPFIFFLFLFAGLLVSAQQYSFKNYTVAHGLGSLSINHIFQDSKGYIWFATQGGGASRFNGREFQNFTKAEGLVNNDVTYIAEDKNGNIWIATASGASEFNGTAFHNYTKKEGLSDGVIYAIYVDQNNKVWFATQENGIRIYDRTTFDSITTEHGLPTNEVYCITQDKSGNYWFGLAEGVVKYRDGKITSYADSTFRKGNSFFCSLVDDSNNVWFGSIGSGVLVIRNENQLQLLELPALIQNDFIGGIMQDKKGNKWFATDHGLLKYNGNEFKLFSEKEGLSVNIAQTVFCDYEGNIWTGTLGGGVNLLSSEAFVHYTDKDGLASENITCMHSAGDSEAYYIGTGEGVCLFTPASANPFRKITGIQELEQANITSLSTDVKGNLWLCKQEGVIVLEKQGNNFRVKRKYERIAGERIVSPTKIIHDAKGNCWIATYGSGVFFVNGKTERCYSTKTGFSSDKILTLYEDAHSNIWLGTQDAGIFKFNGEAFSPLQGIVGEAESVWTITMDEAGHIYWGSGESGIFRFDGKQIKNFTSSDGLQTNHVIALVWDKNANCLWGGSEQGIDQIKFSENGSLEQAHAYTELDGFHAAGINPGSLLLAHNGSLLLGTQNGLWLFDGKKDSPKNIPPKFQLTDIRLFYQKVDWKKFTDSIDVHSQLPVDLELPSNKNHLTFDIQALTVLDVRYIFMLDGQDAAWSEPTRNNEITFSNIAPGSHYTFKAKAVNSEGISSETILFSFTVNPPWWSTWWFRTAVILAAVGALVVFIKAREKVLIDQNVKLETIVKQRTLEIARQKEVVEKTLSEKEGLLHEKEILLKEIHHRVKNNLQTISSMLMLQSAGLQDEQAKKAIAESQNRVRSIALVHQKLYQTDGLEKVELSAFVRDLTEQVKSFYRQQAQRVSIIANIPEVYILIDKVIPLGLILNELLANSFKYAFDKTASGEIKIQMQFDEANSPDSKGTMRRRKARLSYADSGTGFDFTKAGASSLGLRLVKLLSQQIGATVEYSNLKGSEFIFTFDLNV